MSYLHSHTIDDAFHSALLALKRALIDGGISEEVEQMAQWANVKSDTVYKWLARKNTPRDFRTIWRLSRGSTAAGYTVFAQAMCGGQVQVREQVTVCTDGRLANEHGQNTRIWCGLLEAEEAGDAKALLQLAGDLSRNAVQVEHECQRIAAEAGVNTVTLIVSTGDGFGRA